MLKIESIPVLKDNYIHLLIKEDSNECTVVDPALSEPVLQFVESRGLTIVSILVTHHHEDHVGGIKSLKAKTNCKVFGPQSEKLRVPEIEIGLKDREVFTLCDLEFECIDTPGHTIGHMVYFNAKQNILFCGDTLFLMGCGRLFEGSPKNMHESLSKIKRLPPETKIYCTHEYTQDNLEFCLSILPNFKPLLERRDKVLALRKDSKFTVPGVLSEELETNLFLMGDHLELQKALKMEGETEVNVFTRLRKLKDKY